jgi:gliding motility-associated-like protein
MQSLVAQVELNGRPLVNNVECQHTRLGSIELSVKQTFPPYTYAWNTGQTTNKITDLEPGDYNVKITDASGADTIIHFSIVELDCDLIPEVFLTPNGDEYNDTWRIQFAQYFPNALILVYNKLGQKVFEFSGKYEFEDQWDGTDLLGKPLPTGSYFFVVYADKSNKGKIRKGTVSIIR